MRNVFSMQSVCRRDMHEKQSWGRDQFFDFAGFLLDNMSCLNVIANFLGKPRGFEPQHDEI